ncbi:hypothetical protein B566_EDAN001460 [Ephemera danica]|nr:hypothetical protein B566_EDAN001460 [Ephemera danica]
MPSDAVGIVTVVFSLVVLSTLMLRLFWCYCQARISLNHSTPQDPSPPLRAAMVALRARRVRRQRDPPPSYDDVVCDPPPVFSIAIKTEQQPSDPPPPYTELPVSV